jgi:hypothetical protein
VPPPRACSCKAKHAETNVSDLAGALWWRLVRSVETTLWRAYLMADTAYHTDRWIAAADYVLTPTVHDLVVGFVAEAIAFAAHLPLGAHIALGIGALVGDRLLTALRR